LLNGGVIPFVLRENGMGVVFAIVGLFAVNYEAVVEFSMTLLN